MTERLKEIYANLPDCEVFADIGCDHGYFTKAMLDGKKCKRAIVSDVSAKCLQKALDLLSDYVELGLVDSAVSDGFDKVGPCDCALIAGMGGEEIISILNRRKDLPENLVLQPMKNADKVRTVAVSLGYKIKTDYIFKCGKIFYDLIVLTKGQDSLTREEIEFGRTNLINRGVAFRESLECKIKVLSSCVLDNKVSDKTKEEMEKEIKRLKNYV
ncbi:MAG: SAM-dependent methyltransferase [Clostridia bacterium]|nr:SAM-dependent methyltransferase [Clostridia bacterium]